MLCLCEEFARYKVGYVENSINSRFSLARWKLYDEQVNGGLALQMLLSLQGRHHTVCTGVTVRQGDKIITQSESTEVYFRPATEAELRSYIATGEPMDKAGAYGIQEKGALLVEKINGDFFNVMGLPVLRLSRMLAEFGVKLL